MHLEELDHEASIGQQQSVQRDQNKTSDVQTRCDSTVPEEPRAAEQQSSTSPAAEVDGLGSRQSRVNTSSSSSELVTTNAPFLPDSKKLQADETCQTERCDEIENLKAEVNSLRDDLRRSDEMVTLLKRHIELNSASDGSPEPSFSPDIIVALAQEVERLNAELEKHSTEGRMHEQTRELASQTDPIPHPMASGSSGNREAEKAEARPTSSLSAQNLDSTLTDLEAVALDRNNRQKSASVDDLHQLCEKPRDSVKGAMLVCDAAAGGDGAVTSTHPLSAASFTTGDLGSFLASPSTRNMLRQSILFSHSPFDSTNAANQRAFAALQAEVERLRHRLELTELENSKLLERSARESVGSFTIAASGRPSFNPPADESLFLDGSLVKYSASGDVTMAAGFLKKLVNVSTDW